MYRYILAYLHCPRAGVYACGATQVVQVPKTGQTIYGKLYPSMEAAGEAAGRLEEMLEQRCVRAVVDKREFLGVESVVEAVEYMLSGVALGKVVVRMP